MADPGPTLHQALLALRGQKVGPDLPALPARPADWEDVIGEWGGRTAIADYLDAHDGGLAKGTHNRTRLLRNLRSWELGHTRRAPPSLLERLRRHTPLRRETTAERKRLRAEQPTVTPTTMAEVLDLIAARGLTILRFIGDVGVHDTDPFGRDVEDSRPRRVNVAYFIPADKLTAGRRSFIYRCRQQNWDAAAQILAGLWGQAYGIDRLVFWVEIDTLELKIGSHQVVS